MGATAITLHSSHTLILWRCQGLTQRRGLNIATPYRTIEPIVQILVLVTANLDYAYV